MSEDADTVVVEADLDAAPDKVWRALTEPELLGAWLLPGEEEGGEVDCELLEAESGKSLRYRWREADAGMDSEVRFVLTPTPDGGVHLQVTHAPVVVSLAKARARLRPAIPMRMAA